MFTENEVATILEIPEVLDAVNEAKELFKSKQAEYLDLSEHDFLSLILMTPTVGIALANGSISLFEELALNKMARKMSKGGYFLKIDPVTHGMKFLIKDYETWETPFFNVIRVAMNHSFDLQKIRQLDKEYPEVSVKSFAHELMHMPYMFVRYIVSFFLHDENDIVETRSISKVEYQKIEEIGVKLDLVELHFFQSFCKTFQIK